MSDPVLNSPDDVKREIIRLSRDVKSANDRAEAAERGAADLQVLLQKERDATAAARLAGADRNLGPDREVVARFVYDANDPAIRNAPRADLIKLGNDKVALIRSYEADGDCRPGLLDSAAASDWHRDFNQALTNRNFARAILKRGNRAPHTPQLNRECARVFERGPFAEQFRAAGGNIERIFSDSTGIGAELVFDEDMPMLERAIDMAPGLGDLFRQVSATQPTITFPFLDSGFQPYLTGGAPTVDVPANYTPSSAGFSERSYTVKEMAIRAIASRNAIEDSVIAFLPMLTEEFARATRRAEDDVIVNSDTAGTHQDTGLGSWTTRGYWMNGTGGSLDHRRHSQGLRARAFDVSNTTDQNAVQTPAGARAQRVTLGIAGIEDGVYVTSPEYYLAKMLGWQDFKELDSYGIQNATIVNGIISGPLQGQVGYIDRTPIVVSPLVTPDLAATGLYTGSGALTGMLYVNRSRFMRIVKNGRRVESATNIENGTTVTVSTVRWLFATLDSALVKNVHWGYNLATT